MIFNGYGLFKTTHVYSEVTPTVALELSNTESGLISSQTMGTDSLVIIYADSPWLSRVSDIELSLTGYDRN